MRCEVTPPYSPFDDPDSLDARVDADDGSCGPAASAQYRHEPDEPVRAATPSPCVGAPSAPQGDLAPPEARVPATSSAMAAPGAPGLPTLHAEGLEGSAGAGSADPQAAAGEAGARFHRPVDRDGRVSEDFRERPVESTRVEIEGPVAASAGYAPAVLRAAEPLRVDRAEARAPARDEPPADASGPRARPVASAGEAAPARPPAEPPAAPASWTPPREVALRSAMSGAAGLDRDLPPMLSASIAALVVIAAAALYHRITGPRVAEHPRRAAILRELDATPGLTATELARKLDLHPTSVVHHLRRLREAGVVTAQTHNGRTRYSHARGTATSADVARSVLLRVPLARDLLAVAVSRPGLTLGEAAAAVGVSRFAVRLQIERLREADLLVVKQDGNARRIFPA